MCSKFKNSILDMSYSKGDAQEQFEKTGETGVGDNNLVGICTCMVFKVMDLD